MAMYIHGCTGNHGQKYNYPFGSYNSYGMTIGHLAYVRTKAMGWNTVQLASPDYSNSMKYCNGHFMIMKSYMLQLIPQLGLIKYDNQILNIQMKLMDMVSIISWRCLGWIKCTKKLRILSGMFTLDITKFLGFYVSHGYIPGSGNWEDDMKLLNLRPINEIYLNKGN